ncbi:hypothetical protein DFH07DRAFT_943780 [Mycena maculata]|uniref:Uncharacterized protein n=1 Tax=Mycena maculata TaxID=230809 RepID=A0AAD7IE24_9AGAR|nr:hypothetical protein DFH07DRAFT_943780 [Mycena maculata]
MARSASDVGADAEARFLWGTGTGSASCREAEEHVREAERQGSLRGVTVVDSLEAIEWIASVNVKLEATVLAMGVWKSGVGMIPLLHFCFRSVSRYPESRPSRHLSGGPDEIFDTFEFRRPAKIPSRPVRLAYLRSFEFPRPASHACPSPD